MRIRLTAALATAALATIAGCVSLKRTPEARFFALQPVAEAPAAVAAPPSDSGLVGVLPVLLPGHLERPQLVRWSGPGELQIDEFLRWAEPLDSGVLRVLAQDLETLLPAHRVIRAPWPGSTTPLLCRVRVEIVRFGPQPGGELSLSGRFTLLPARSERPLLAQSFELHRDSPAGSDAPGRAVAGMSALLADLARQIAAAVAALPPAPSDDRPAVSPD